MSIPSALDLYVSRLEALRRAEPMQPPPSATPDFLVQNRDEVLFFGMLGFLSVGIGGGLFSNSLPVWISKPPIDRGHPVVRELIRRKALPAVLSKVAFGQLPTVQSGRADLDVNHFDHLLSVWEATFCADFSAGFQILRTGRTSWPEVTGTKTVSYEDLRHLALEDVSNAGPEVVSTAYSVLDALDLWAAWQRLLARVPELLREDVAAIWNALIFGGDPTTCLTRATRLHALLGQDAPSGDTAPSSALLEMINQMRDRVL